MGGATSKLDETDWTRADGKLSSSEQTLVGAAPTKEYGLYYLTKKAVNQREFDITDSEHNLLYTTRAVPGTIACFDVLSGKEIQEEEANLLRISVDLTRKYWIVYRFSTPTFPGQKHDRDMTDKLACEFAEKPNAPPTPFLYKRACITVSWSRYMAVAALYGAPTVEQIMQRRILDDAEVSDSMEEEDEQDDIFSEALKISERMKDRTPDEPNDSPSTKEAKEEDNGSVQGPLSDSTGTDDELQQIQSNDPPGAGADSSEFLHLSASMPELHHLPPSDPDEVPSSASLSNSPRASPSSNTATVSMRGWIRQQSLAIREKSQAVLASATGSQKSYQDPLEGVIKLDEPLLLCQEIYHHFFVGNHQTSIVSKDKVLELLQQDMAQHLADSPEEAQRDRDNLNPLLAAQEEISRIDVSPGNGSQECKDPDGQRPNVDVYDANNRPDDYDEQEQPLVGYWMWNNTLRVHRMKMHVAKGADLCLHVVLAIIVNQVRYERNAIAMTV